MSMRFALIAAAALVAACSSSKPTPMPQAPIGMSKKPSASVPYVSDVNEIRVRLDSDIGVESVDHAFTARLLTPLMRPDGIVFAAAGSLVHGHVVSTSQHRVELAFDRLETRDGVYRIDAVVISAAPYAITVRPHDGVRTSTLEATQPTAIGGGPPIPSESEEEASRAGEVIVPFDADVRLKLTELVRMEH
ncbi:MAG: hypothetical protein ACXWUG_27355 [Polyangiales bacterium]